MADGYFPTLVSKNADPNAAANPLLVELSDGTSALTTSGGSLSVVVANGAGGSAVNIQDGGNSITVDGTVAATQSGTWSVGVTNGAGASAVNIQDGGNSITVDGSVSITGSVVVTATALDIRALTLATDAVKVSANTTANSSGNPIWVASTTGAITGAVADYATATVTANSSVNHDYTVVTSMLLKSVSFASSGGGKVELKVGPLATLVSKWVGFVPKEGGEVKMSFDPPILVPVTSTGTVRLVTSNRENQSQDLYSTIVGIDA